jgi:hypothetical protein
MNRITTITATVVGILAAGAAAGGGGGVVKGGSPNPAYSNFYAWYKADNGVNGSAGLATDGASVTRWNDSTTNGRDLVRYNSTVSRQPVMDHDGGNGAASVEFNGDDYIWANQTTEFGQISTGRTIFAVVRADAANGGYVFDSCTSAGRNALFTGQLSAPGQWVAYTGTATIACGAVDTGQLQLITMTLESGAQTIRINGRTAATGTASLQDLPGLLLGARYNVVNGYSGGISEFMVYDAALSDADRASIESYLDTKYDLQDPCPADLDGNGNVGPSDIGLLIAAWGTGDIAADIDDNGTVDGFDLAYILGGWGACP